MSSKAITSIAEQFLATARLHGGQQVFLEAPESLADVRDVFLNVAKSIGVHVFLHNSADQKSEDVTKQLHASVAYICVTAGTIEETDAALAHNAEFIQAALKLNSMILGIRDGGVNELEISYTM